jgi:hypothetical protein
MGISMTVLLILLAGIVDLGRAFFTFVAMRDAAQEAALYASAYPSDCARIQIRAAAALEDISYDELDVWVGTHHCIPADPYPDPNANTPTVGCAGKEIVVSVIEDDFPIAMPFLGTLLGRQTVPITATVKGTVLRPPCTTSP